MTFGGSLVRNACLADSKREFWRKSGTKRSFLETVRVTFGESFVVSYETLLVCGQTVWRNCVRDVTVTQCHADLRGLGGKCVCMAPCQWGARNMLV